MLMLQTTRRCLIGLALACATASIGAQPVTVIEY